MSLFDCIQRAMDDPDMGVNRQMGIEAQAMWRELSDRYERQGNDRQTAEALAAKDMPEFFRRKAGEDRHRFITTRAANRAMEAAAPNEGLRQRVERTEYKHRALIRRFNGSMKDYLKRHHRDLLGRVKHEAEQGDILRELRGEATGNNSARAIADAIRHSVEDMRLMFNERGGLIGKLDNYDLPHSHSRLSLMRAGKEEWAAQIEVRLDWEKVIDPLTGKPMPRGADGMPPLEWRRNFLGAIYNNIVFGREVEEPMYGRPKGQPKYRQMSEHRVLHFKSADDWIAYNRDFGTGGVHQSLMSHVSRMARDIAQMEDFGPNPNLGAEYYADLRLKGAAGDEARTQTVEAENAVGKRMMNVLSGGAGPQTPMEAWIGVFLSNARGLITAAFLDRAIIASFSDMNTMRLAAKSMGMNGGRIMQRQLGLLKALSREELLRAGWIADTMADAGTALARFQNETPSSEIGERITQASMRVQGLNFWTDRARAVGYQEWSGALADFAGRPMTDLPKAWQDAFRKWNVTAEDWAAFSDPATLFRADNGATFMMPLYWRQATSLPLERADEVFFKMQGAAEEFLEGAVPSQSILAQGYTDPAAWGATPGSLPYEILKSGGAFKSFTMTFSINQYRQIMARGGFASQGGLTYALDLAAGATILGMISLQVGEMLMGRDPQDMTDPMTWARAAAKGGGFAILGDVVMQGQASWGGGFASYVAGPVPQAMNDVWGITLGPAMTQAWSLATTGEMADTNYVERLARFGRRYTPMGQTPAIGPALDRLLWDQLQIMLDPESADALADAAQRRQNLNSNGAFWMPGEALPGRAPNLGNAIGQP